MHVIHDYSISGTPKEGQDTLISFAGAGGAADFTAGASFGAGSGDFSGLVSGDCSGLVLSAGSEMVSPGTEELITGVSSVVPGMATTSPGTSAEAGSCWTSTFLYILRHYTALPKS
jgi:hypothetical protein